MNRRLVSWTSWAGFGALGTSFCVASACSQASPPGFSNNNGNNGNDNGGSDNSSSSTNGNGGGGASSSSSSEGAVYTNNNNNGNNGNGNNGNGNSGSGNTGNPNSGSTSTGTPNSGTSGSTGATGTGTGTGTGTAVAGGASTGCGSTPNPMCSAPTGTGAFAYSECYQSTVGTGGYAFVATDGVSTGCVDSTSLCGAGTLAAEGPTYANWGAAIGFNVGQAAGAAAIAAVTPTGTGLTWSLTATPAPTLPGGLQISIIGGDGTQYCYRPAMGVTSGMTPWSSFNTLCYNPTPDGGVFVGPDQIEKVQFQAISTAASGAWGFCVATVSL